MLIPLKNYTRDNNYSFLGNSAIALTGEPVPP